MCGIVGSTEDKNSIIKKMCRALTHRGPDSEGYYFDNNISLGMRRLKIIDLDKGDQPIFNSDRSIVTVFNGEIYNYRSLRKKLSKNGITFQTNSDTETIVYLYQKYKDDFATKLRGMFSIAIWDKKASRLVLARDRIGIKPLYYYFNNNKLLFSSEIKSLLIHPDVCKELNFEALNHYFTFGYIPAPLSIFNKIYKVLPGHLLIYEDGQIYNKQYWDLPLDKGRQMDTSFDSNHIKSELSKLIYESIELHLVSDVPVGAFLSGGLDSGSLIALSSQVSNNPMKTFSIGFEDKYLNELENASLVAEMYGTDHNEYIVKPTDIDELEKIMFFYDEPFADSSAIPTYFVSKFAGEHVKVAFSGDGGDEIFAGYGNYKADKIIQYLNKFPLVTKNKFVQSIINLLPIGKNSFSFTNQLKKLYKILLLDPELAHVFWLSIISENDKNKLYINDNMLNLNKISSLEYYRKYFDHYKNKDFINTCILTDIKTVLPDDYLTKVDRASMANSVEVRVPFLDHKLVEYCSNLPSKYKMQGFETKSLLKQIMKDKLPKQIISGKKKGFSIPLNKWFKQDFNSLFEKYLSIEEIKSQGLFNHKFINELINNHSYGKVDSSKSLWSIIAFQIWYKNYYE